MGSNITEFLMREFVTDDPDNHPMLFFEASCIEDEQDDSGVYLWWRLSEDGVAVRSEVNMSTIQQLSVIDSCEKELVAFGKAITSKKFFEKRIESPVKFNRIFEVHLFNYPPAEFLKIPVGEVPDIMNFENLSMARFSSQHHTLTLTPMGSRRVHVNEGSVHSLQIKLLPVITGLAAKFRTLSGKTKAAMAAVARRKTK